MRAYRKSNVFLMALLTTTTLSACTSSPQKPAAMTALSKCGWLPNCVNTGSEDSSIQPLPATRTQWRALKLWLAQQPNWTVVDYDGDFIQLTATTPTLEFIDDIQLLFKPEQELIQVRSSSRLGIGDMGTNARRVESLRGRIAEFN